MTQRHRSHPPPCSGRENAKVDEHRLCRYDRAVNQPLIGYVRVSTRKQGISGLGLEAQEAAVRAYAQQVGASVVALYFEVESGKSAERKELAKAIAHAKHSGGKLVIAKLDRLARNVAFTSAVMASGVDFVCCDNPHANKLTLHVLSAMAEYEAEQASLRTKAALSAARARGVKLGSSRPGHWSDPGRAMKRLEGIRKAVKHAAKVRAAAATGAYTHLEPLLRDLRAQGASLREMAATLNKQGHLTRKGKPWNPVQVSRVMGRMKEKGLL